MKTEHMGFCSCFLPTSESTHPQKSFEQLFIKHFTRKAGYRPSFEHVLFAVVCDPPFESSWVLYLHFPWKGWSITGFDCCVLLLYFLCSMQSCHVGHAADPVWASSMPFPKHMPLECFLNLASSLTSEVIPRAKTLKKTQNRLTNYYKSIIS